MDLKLLKSIRSPVCRMDLFLLRILMILVSSSTEGLHTTKDLTWHTCYAGLWVTVYFLKQVAISCTTLAINMDLRARLISKIIWKRFPIFNLMSFLLIGFMVKVTHPTPLRGLKSRTQ